jgi:hypothetical protein
MKDKGLDANVEDVRRGSGTNLPSTGHTKQKFNAFRLRENAPGTSSEAKTRNAKEEKPRQIQITYGSETITVNQDGTVDEANITYPKGSVIKVSGIGSGNRSFAEMKVCPCLPFNRGRIGSSSEFYHYMTSTRRL